MVLTRTLFERIRQKCNEQGWRPDEAYHRMEHEQYYPPATESQLLATEAVLGFRLPPTLRTLYAQVVLGSFITFVIFAVSSPTFFAPERPHSHPALPPHSVLPYTPP
jgi:hypothetical protein